MIEALIGVSSFFAIRVGAAADVAGVFACIFANVALFLEPTGRGIVVYPLL
jgi:hypothetical protein